MNFWSVALTGKKKLFVSEIEFVSDHTMLERMGASSPAPMPINGRHEQGCRKRKWSKFGIHYAKLI
jgi:hypothetical protein